MKRRNIVLEFTADWCTYCREIQPMVSRLQRDGHPIQQVDADKNKDLMNRMGVNALPCFVLLVDGKIEKKLLNHPGDSFRTSLNEMLTTARDARETNMQKLKTMVAEQGRKRSLDGGEQSSERTASADVKLVANGNEESGFDFSSFGLGGNEEQAKVSAPAVRPEDNLDPGEEMVSFNEGPISTVRIKVNDGVGVNFGTGTIISSTNNRTFILSCGHIFRGLTRGDQVEVDVFVKGKTHTIKAHLLNFDSEKLDLGLLGVEFDYEFPTSPVAALSSLPVSRESVYSIGCGGGDLPTRIDMEVTQLNRYKGPDTIECTTMPERGRSGGGLFTSDGELVGVCICAQPQEKRGIYTSLKPIYQFLDQTQLSFLHPPTIETNAAEAESAIVENDTMNGIPDFGEDNFGEGTDAAQPFGQIADNGTAPVVSPAAQSNQSRESQLLQKAMAHAGNAEIICLVRPQNDPDGEPRIVLINKATPTLINYLKQNPQPTTVPVMHSVPNGNPPATGSVDGGLPQPGVTSNQPFNGSIPTSGPQTASRSQERYLPPLDTTPFSDAPGVNNSPWAQQNFDR